MTRETKIGLLVGLAFIIVIGILLSDHLTSSTEPPPATLANVGSHVMQTVNTPGSANTAPITTITTPEVTPQAPVPTNADLSPQPQPLQIVQIGPGGQQHPQPITVQNPLNTSGTTPANGAGPVITVPVETSPLPEFAGGSTTDDPIITHVPPYADPAVVSTAQRGGEALVALDASGRPVSSPTPATWSQALTGMREYKAEPNDTVSAMAQKFLGANTKTNRDAIVRANPSLQKNPDRVIVGQTYLIPVSVDGPASVATGANEVAVPQPPVPTSTGMTVASSTEYWYTVREGDSLWKIANEQLGNPGAVSAIKELNQLKSDTIQAGVRLRLPAKPLAQAN